MPQSQDPRGTRVNDEYAELNTVTMPLKALGELRAPPVIGDVIGDQNPCQIAAAHLVVMPRYACGFRPDTRGQCEPAPRRPFSR